VFAGPIDNNNRVHKPARWVPDGAGYRFEFLPLLDGDSSGYVRAITEAGVMVGGTSEGVDYHPAVWSADGATVTDLNSLLPEDSDWLLVVASDINDNGLVVGFGEYAGVERGFILDLLTGAIEPIPLLAGAMTNDAWKINHVGEVLGVANDDIVGGGPIPQGGWGYFWAGPGSVPVQLPSASSGMALARGLNNSAELVGDSWVADSNQLANDGDMCVWLPGGGVTKVGTLIPTKPSWYLKYGYDINDDGWMTGDGRKFVKGKYTWMGILVVPN
jgi:uncharacterized membrane protein